MDSGDAQPTRRRLLRLAATGSLAGVAGCINTPPPNGTIMVEREEQSVDWCLDDLEESVPEAERTAVSIDGLERQAQDSLTSKTDAGYVCGPQDGMLCGNCTFYIDDKTGDGIGACAVVQGQIRSVDWCGLWQPREKMTGGDSE